MNQVNAALLPTRDNVKSRDRSRTPLRQVVDRFLRHRLACLCLLLLAAWACLSIAAPWVTPYDPNRVEPTSFREAPGAEHWLGTDLVGRDVLTRLIYGSRTSLVVGLGAVSAYVVLGTILGAAAGYFGGLVDAIISRLIDIILCFPIIVVVLTLVSLVGPSLPNIVLTIALLRWPQVARYVRAEFLALRGREFVVAAQAIGVRPFIIAAKHMLPNALSPIVVVATFGVANTILLEASLSFLGFGVPPPTASWGNMLSDAQRISILEGLPWMWLPAGLAIAGVVLAINFVGDGLRDALDPHMKVD